MSGLGLFSEGLVSLGKGAQPPIVRICVTLLTVFVYAAAITLGSTPIVRNNQSREPSSEEISFEHKMTPEEEANYEFEKKCAGVGPQGPMRYVLAKGKDDPEPCILEEPRYMAAPQ